MADSVFAFYPATMAATLTPSGEDVVFLDQDPTFGEYQPENPAPRGAVLSTLGGAVVQRFDPVPEDGRITFSETDVPGGQDTLDALQALFLAGSALHFTDGTRAWRVEFAPADGFNFWLNERWRRLRMSDASLPVVYSYAVNLVIRERVL